MADAKGHTLSDLVRLAALAALASAVVKELAKPKAERTWHGTVARVVPYDLRKPTLERLRERMWAPEDEQLIKPHVFGVGWTVNLGRVVALAKAAREKAASH